MNHKKELPRGPTTWVPWVLGSFGVSVFEGLKFGGFRVYSVLLVVGYIFAIMKTQ